MTKFIIELMNDRVKLFIYIDTAPGKRGSIVKANNDLLLIYDLFWSLSRCNDAGYLGQIISMLEFYSTKFDKVLFITYDDKIYTNLPANVKHVPSLVGLSIKSLQLKRLIHFAVSGFLITDKIQIVEITGTTMFLAAFINKLLNRRIILSHRWSLRRNLSVLGWPYCCLSPLALIMDIIAFRLADIIIAYNPRLAEEAKLYANNDKVYYIPNYVDTYLFKPLNKNKLKNSLIFVGRLHKVKNLHLLLQVMKNLPNISLTIIGEGPQRSELLKIKEVELINNVSFLGMIPNEKLPEYLNCAEAFILISRVEGHPRVILEAMACGLPCIGSNVEGIKDIINDETGLLCDLDVESIGKAILHLFSDSNKLEAMGRSARNYALNNYSMEAILDKKTELIKCTSAL